jgi:hypothetical protein
MALEATHIRFALSLMNDYGISNEKEYILGTSYPDSRYATGISREFTHGAHVLRKDFAINDFKKGWQVHEICDRIQHEAFKKFIPLLDQYEKEWPDEKWIDFTALKIIQDISDRQQYDVKSYMNYLKNAENPNQEDIEKVRAFNKYLIDLYAKEISTENYCEILIACGVKEALARETTSKVSILLQDKVLIKQVDKVFPYMVAHYKDIL